MRRWTPSTCLMADVRLVIFDVDGTLVDSEASIVGAMSKTYAACGLAMPARSAIRGAVGLSLRETFDHLSPGATDQQRLDLIEGYKHAYHDAQTGKTNQSSDPFFPGARDLLDVLKADPFTILAVATGKSRRGLARLIAAHGLDGYFRTVQTADTHPSKPHPSMIHAILAETGIAPARAVMVGDTSYDIEMARAAGVRSIAVGWGYHLAEQLNATRVAQDFARLRADIDDLLGVSA